MRNPLFGLPLTFIAIVAAQPPVAPRQADETVELSPFVVDASTDVGYLAGNTLAGTRLNQSLKDTAASISVFTPEFLSDISAFNLTDAVAYAVNVELQLDDDRPALTGNETVNEYQKYRVRGLPASVTRNYFGWNLPTETYNLERIEDSRGPNSVLFGIGSPGGILNASTKQAITGRSFHKASGSFGSFESWRTAVDLNEPVIKNKLAVRLNAVWDKNNSFRHWAGEESRRAHLAVVYDLSNKSRFRAEFERGQIFDNAPRNFNLNGNPFVWIGAGRPTFPTYVSNASIGISRQSFSANANPRVTYVSNIDQAYATMGVMYATGPNNNAVITNPEYTDYSINFGGPAQNRFGRFNAYSAFVEHRFSKNTAIEIGYNHQEMNMESYDPRTSGNLLQGDPNQFLPDGRPNPEAGKLYLESSWFRTKNSTQSNAGRATFTTGHDAKTWGNYRVAAYTEYSRGTLGNETDNEEWVDATTGVAPYHATPDNGNNYVWRRTYPTERDWPTYYVNGPGRFGLLQGVYDPVTKKTLNTTWEIPRARPRETASTQKTYMVALQVGYFQERLLIGGGVRRDDYHEHTLGTFRDPTTQIYRLAYNSQDADPGSVTDYTTVARNKTLGVVLHATKDITLYYNQADNIQLPPRGQNVLTDAGTPGLLVPAPSPKGRGRDFGVGVDLFRGRMYARATYYQTAARNLSTTFSTSVPSSVNDLKPVEKRIMDTLLSASVISQADYDLWTNLPSYQKYDQNSSGYELQLTANLSSHWRAQMSYSYTDAVQENQLNEARAWAVQNEAFLASRNTTGLLTSAGYTIQQEIANYETGIEAVTATNGIQKLGNRHEKVSVFTRYDIPWETLKGLYVGGGYRFQSKIFTGADPLGNRVYAPSFWRSDALLGFKWRGLKQLRNINFQLNVMNVFDQRDPLITRYINNVPNGPIQAEVVQAPRTWRFTTSFDF